MKTSLTFSGIRTFTMLVTNASVYIVSKHFHHSKEILFPIEQFFKIFSPPEIQQPSLCLSGLIRSKQFVSVGSSDTQPWVSVYTHTVICWSVVC